MEVRVQNYTLSALNPVEISYNFNNKEVLNGEYRLYSNGMRNYNYELFKKSKDVAISKKTAIILTDVKDLKNIFKEPLVSVQIGNISGNCYLETKNNNILEGDVFVKNYNKSLWIGGKGEKAVFTIIPVAANIVEMKVKNFYVQIEESYPYNIVLSENSLPNNKRYNQQFVVDFIGNFITFKYKTVDNQYRFLSYNLTDRKLRCVGVELNKTIINQYLFKATFVSSTSFQRGFNPSIQEVKYFNSVDDGPKQKSVEIYQKTQTNTNLLVTLPTYKLLNSSSSANMTILKTNFSVAGTFNNSI